jgi:hypothetical protein
MRKFIYDERVRCAEPTVFRTVFDTERELPLLI